MGEDFNYLCWKNQETLDACTMSLKSIQSHLRQKSIQFLHFVIIRIYI